VKMLDQGPYKPRTGLNVPVITVLDDAGNIIEADQRRVLHYIIQRGFGADSIFLSSTTGEWNRITNSQRQQLLQIGIEEIRRANTLLDQRALPVEAWAGVTALTKAETLENLELAAQLKAEMAVIAPLGIADLRCDEIVDFFERDVAGIVNSKASDRGPLPVCLYDNPELAVDAAVPNLPLSCVELLSRLPFVVCIKASVSRQILQDYLRAFWRRDLPESLCLYVGNAPLIFRVDEVQREAGISSQELAVAGVVSGQANLLPREWQSAWQAIVNRETDLIRVYEKIFADFDEIYSTGQGQPLNVKLIAGIKQAMYSQGIISSPCVAQGTPALTKEEAELLSERLEKVLNDLRAGVDLQCLSNPA